MRELKGPRFVEDEETETLDDWLLDRDLDVVLGFSMGLIKSCGSTLTSAGIFSTVIFSTNMIAASKLVKQ